jgi:hypothetical protein
VRLALEAVVGKPNVTVTTRKFGDVPRMAKHLHVVLRETPAVMVTALCRLIDYGVTAQHAFVVTTASKDGVGIVDSLGRRPATESAFNAWIHSQSSGDRRFATVDGARWTIDMESPLSIFRIYPRPGAK